MVFWQDLHGDRVWDPFREWDQLQDRFNRLFSGVRSGRAAVTDFPAFNLSTGEEGAVLTAEIPGVDAKQLDLSVVADTLTIRGERPRVKLKEGETFHRQERSWGKFSRSIQLPFVIEGAKVHAESKNGVLHVMLPRAESEKAKRITVKAS